MGPANMASSPTTPPTARPAVIPFSLAPVATFRIVYISSSVNTISSTKACQGSPAGSVAPSVG